MASSFLFVCLLIVHLGLISASHHEPNMDPGKTTLVHLFEWKWDDVAIECEQFLGPYGYGGVQVSPANENGIIWEPFWSNEVKRPWWERYQPVSYKIATRSGNEEEFRSMVRRCNTAGVRIYVDCVINHMTGYIGEGHGTGGSHFNPEALQYDGVPYGPGDFNDNSKCNTESGNIESYDDANQVRNCRLQGLADLDLGQDYVREKISEYMNKLISMGVAGFRIDAAKHMWPHDLSAIYDRLDNLSEEFFAAGTKPFIFQEVIDMGGEAIKSTEYVSFGRVTEFRYGISLGNVIRKNNGQRLSYLRNYGEGWSFLNGQDALVFIDNHDNQRGHGAGGFGSILTFFESRMYKMAAAFMLAWPYGTPRVMSSYQWPRHIEHGKDINDWIGPPNDNYDIKSVIRNSDLTCGNGWVCEHRWRQIFNMVKFRNVVGFAEMGHWWDNSYHQIAFARIGRGFIAINNESHDLNQRLQTGLPEGTYCDVISGNKDGDRCTGHTVQVDSSGHADLHVSYTWEDPMIAIHVEAKF